MNKFKGYYIPEKVTFHNFITEKQAEDKNYNCNCLCGIEHWTDGWDFYHDPRCADINCTDCIFFENNNLIRAEYFKKLKEEK